MNRTHKDVKKILNVAQEQEEDKKLEDRNHAKEYKVFEDDFFIPKNKSGLDNKRFKDTEGKLQDSKDEKE